MLTQAPLTVLIVDDEPLARARLRALLESCQDPHAQVVAEASTASGAQAWLREHGCDLALLDVQMPGPDGLMLAESLRHHPRPPLVAFVTAHARHAVEAYELEALDYLTKPVRLERLQATLTRAAQRLREREAAAQAAAGAGESPEDDVIPINDRGRVLRLPVSEVLYLKAELKYLTVRTATHRYVMDGTLNDWEQRLGMRFLRVHRNALVAKAAVRELDRHAATEAEPESAHAPLDDGGVPGEAWAVRVAHVGEWLSVSRRQLASVREALRALQA
ncbi:MAG: response regulator transcription factor [Burkholderiales bacterium]|uniref:LytR/AlgR family response regulator transcription factor n=1 Tax=Inhella sp. TaxID=1921806 RepID=UPI001AC4D9E3|nr:response regulator transcription factor [Burkholderiales bacterium]